METLITISFFAMILLANTFTEFVGSFKPANKVGRLVVTLLTVHYSLLVFIVCLALTGHLLSAVIVAFIAEVLKTK